MIKERLNLHLDRDLKSYLVRQAEQENRTLSNLVETVIRKYVEQREKEEADEFVAGLLRRPGVAG